MLEIHLLTIFPDMFASPFAASMVKRAQENRAVKIVLHNLRKWTSDQRQTVDDRPFGGGPGMIMLVEPIYLAVKEIKQSLEGKQVKVILTSAKGKVFSQRSAEAYSKLDALIIICGHYEGVDERVNEHIADEEISIGRYILTGGELPAMVITDAVVRLLQGVLGNAASLADESFAQGGEAEYPQYTRPAVFNPDNGDSWKVPELLLNGNHADISKWRAAQKKSA